MNKNKPAKTILLVVVALIVILGAVTAIFLPRYLEQKKEQELQAEREAIYHEAIALFDSNRFEDALYKFKSIKDFFPDAQDMIYQCNYRIAIEAASQEDYSKVERYLIPEEVVNENPTLYPYYWSLVDSIEQWHASQEVTSFLDTLNGTYQDVDDDLTHVVILDGVFYRYSDDYPNSIYEETLTYNADDGTISMSDLSYNMQVIFDGVNLVIDGTAKDTSIKIHAEYGIPLEKTISHKYEKVSDSAEKPTSKPKPSKPVKLDPKIGMTAAEVRRSTWGEPYNINRTTTAYGVHEQWCYHNYKYIYLDDGIVTAIQD